MEINDALACRPDIYELIFDGFEDSSEVLAAFERLEADSETKFIVLNVNAPSGFAVGGTEMCRPRLFPASRDLVGGMM
ncbi:MAG: hypothetical protein IT580_08465 [Verrucomicrobiales bacterium]|nr:hypothetical protein [Verrucomicrobiales bacterium]